MRVTSAEDAPRQAADGRRHRGAAAPHRAAQPAPRRAGRCRPPTRWRPRRWSGRCRRRRPRPTPRTSSGWRPPCAAARRPVFVAGRGARGPGCRAALEHLADRCGALLATSAVAKGLFAGNPWSLDVSGGFASPLAAELIGGADLIVGWGCALNMWTMRHGRLIAPDATVVQVDLDADALGAHRQLTFGVLGDVREVAGGGGGARGGRSERRLPQRASCGARIAARVRWRDVAFEPATEPGRIDPRDTHDRPRRPAAGRADRVGRLGQLHGLPQHVPGRAGRVRVLLHPGVPVASAWAWPPRSARRWRARTGCRSRRWATAACSWAPRSWRPSCGSACRWS